MRSWCRRALVGTFVLLLLWPPGTPSADAQRLPSAAPQPNGAQQASITGTLLIKYGDPQPGTRRADREEISIRDDAGQRVAVTVSDATRIGEALHGLNGKRVTISGAGAMRAAEGSGATEPVIAAQSIARVPGFQASATVTGTTKWATLLCRFPDDAPATVAAYPIPYFTPLILGGEPSAEHYWQENSRQLVNFTGSTFHDWTPLPKTRAQYLAAGPPDTYLDMIAVDCAGAAGAGVDFNGGGYGGINVMLSKQLDPAANSAWGGLSFISLGGGPQKTWPVTWLPEFAYKNQNVVAHEMGHAFRLPHSSGPYGQTYDSKWDVMSDGGVCPPNHPVYGCLGDHTVSYHKDFLGWIPAERRFNYTGTSQTFALSRTAFPDDTAGTFWAARIPIGGSATLFYTVEARKFIGYDQRAPFESLVIHRVDTTRTSNVAQVVDPDNNQNPNDEGAAWTPGETFTDAANNIAVAVLASTATGFQVRIGPANAPPPPTGPASVRVQTTRVSAGRLLVTVDAVGTAAVPANVLRELRFGVATNATIDLGTGAAPFAGGQTIAVPGTPARTTFFVNRVAPGAFIVHLDVADAIGTWKTFVGGGGGVP